MAEAKATLNAETLPKFIEVLGLPPDAPLSDVMASLRALVMADAGEPAPTAETPAEEELADMPPPEGKKPEEDGVATMAAAGRLFAMTGKATFSEAIDDVDTWRKSHLAIESWKAQVAQDREALEAAERGTLYGRLVELGAETPATLWVDPLATKKVAVKRLSTEPLADLRKRVTALSAAKPKANGTTPPAAGGSAPVARLSTRLGDVDVPEAEVAAVKAKAKANGTDAETAVQKYAEIKLRQLSAHGARSED
jgi:hypothetical protein